ncbi:MAG: hypothetical protein V2I47_11760 [Bacteroidales bacterium]|jgi:hypothetical protein|nr:hypothetical protein [Bacteroidales bacterium]
MPGLKDTVRMPVHLAALFFALLIPTLLFSQEVPSTRLKVKGSRFLITADTTIFVLHDSIITMPVDKEYIISRYPPYEQAERYKNIRSKTSGNRVMRSLSKLTFVSTNSVELQGENKKSNITNPYEAYEGKIIGSIDFQVLEPFGPSLDDTTALTYTWLGRFGNSIHINTRQYILRDYLLVNKGELLDPLKLADNELIIRNLNFINDIKIYVIPVGDSDTVNLLYLAKDKFSFGINPIIKTARNFSLKVWNENFYGLGHRVEGEVSVITDRSPVMQFERGRYIIPNINGSFIRGEIGYELLDGQDVYNISFVRGYLPPAIQTGLGMEYNRYVFDDYYLNEDSLPELQDVDVEYLKAFLGHAIMIYENKKPGKHGVYLTPAAAVVRKYYNSKPTIQPGYEGRYRNATLMLGSISLSQNNFYKSRYFYEFGRIEDIPYGLLFNLTGGFESGEVYNRIYSGFSISASDYINNFGYLFGQISAGGYYFEDVIQEGIINMRLEYASGLFRIRHSNFRLFSKMWYTTGINRLPDEYLRFDGDNGIENFSSTLLLDKRRLSFSVEPVVFTPIMFLGFRFVFFGFASFGMIGDVNETIFHNTIYQGYGAGVRIRNDNLVFNTLEISIGFYPGAPSDQDNFLINVNGIPTPEFNNFLPKPPGVVPYR